MLTYQSMNMHKVKINDLKISSINSFNNIMYNQLETQSFQQTFM